MAYDPLTVGEIAPGKPLKESLFDKIRLNFDDHEARLLVAPGGVSFAPNGSFDNDSDGNGVPDSWTLTPIGTGTGSLVTTDYYKLGSLKSLKAYTPGGGGNGLYVTSDYLPRIGYGHMVNFWAGILPTVRGGHVAWAQSTGISLDQIVEPTVCATFGYTLFPYHYQCTVAGTTGTTEPAWETGAASYTDGGVTWTRRSFQIEVQLLEYDNAKNLLATTSLRKVPAILTRRGLTYPFFHKYSVFAAPANAATSYVKVRLKMLMEGYREFDCWLDELSVVPYMPHLDVPSSPARLSYTATGANASFTKVDDCAIWIPPGFSLSDLRFFGTCTCSASNLAVWRLKINGTSTYSNEWPPTVQTWTGTSQPARFQFPNVSRVYEAAGRMAVIELEIKNAYASTPTISIDVAMEQSASGAFGLSL